jgi:hypothetical protein
LPVHLVVHPAIKAHAAHVTKKTCPSLPTIFMLRLVAIDTEGADQRV